LLNLRDPIVLAAAPAGIVLAALAWFVADGRGSAIQPLDRLDARLAATRPDAPRVNLDGSRALSEAVAAPLFVLNAGPGAVADPSVRLDGIAISPRSSMALLSVNGQPSSWTSLGASRDGFMLTEVHADRVVIDTPVAFKEVSLWSATGSQAAASGPTPGAATGPPIRSDPQPATQSRGSATPNAPTPQR